MRGFIRNALLGAAIAAVPVSTTFAAVRPGAAVPTAASTAAAAQTTVYDAPAASSRAVALPVLLGVVGMGLLVLYMAFDEDEAVEFDEPITRG